LFVYLPNTPVTAIANPFSFIPSSLPISVSDKFFLETETGVLLDIYLNLNSYRLSEMTNKNRRKSAGGGMSLPTLLLIIFLILKLTHVIDWSWLWVLSPLWIPASLVVLFFIIIGIILLAALIGLTSGKSRMTAGIKSWFCKKDQEDNIDD
jgi:protein-S-isoprenylcysteine O-methyltransferase Ste14